MNHVVAVLPLMFICICATSILNKSDDSIEDRIINGHVAQQGQFPYIVYIELKLSYGKQWCDGSILSSHWVVSAGHCFYDYRDQPELFNVVSGSIDKCNNLLEIQQMQVASVHVHPRYEKEDDLHGKYNPINDIAMIRLSSDLNFTDTVQPIALPQTFETHNQVATASGWGVIKPGENENPDTLRYFRAMVYRSDECQANYDKEIRDPENFICTMNQQQNARTCRGDSGGPLVQNDVLIGIISFGDPDCISSTSFYTRVFPYMDFINSHLTN